MAVPALIYVAVEPRGRRRGAAGLGDPDRDRHRVRAGRAGGDQHPPAGGAADVPAHPRRGRRPAGDHDHRGLLHRLAARRCRCCWRCCRWRLFAVLVQRRVRSWWLLLPLAAATWALVHASGVHATVAGVLLGFAVPVVRRDRRARARAGRALRAPVPAALGRGRGAGVRVLRRRGVGRRRRRARRGLRRPGRARASSPGWSSARPIGVLGATWLVQRFTRARLADGPELVGRARAGAAGRDRVHRVAADRRAGLRRRQRGATTTSRSACWPGR